jgi:thioredoxin reductase (NADPH)
LPYLIVVDDDPQVLASVRRDLRSHYSERYRIVPASSGQEALDTARQVASRRETVALFLSDQRMPGMSGVDFLSAVKGVFPEAKRVLLTAYSDTEAAIRAINEVSLDYYLMKPWDPPEEKLYPVLDDLLAAWHAEVVPPFVGAQVVGPQWSPLTHELKDFFSGHLLPFRFVDVDASPEADKVLAQFGLDRRCLPAVVLEDGQVLRRPSIAQLAPQIGMRTTSARDVYDLVVVGAGPAGLAAGVYGASEGLRTLVIERRAPGGQAGTSSRIENYLGFPSGLSGADLARRAVTQASRLGAEILTPQSVARIEDLPGGFRRLHLADGASVDTQAIIVATGVDYRRLPVPALDRFTGAGVYYGAATTEAPACRNAHVYVVGGGNSAGQAAMYLSKFAASVNIVIRGAGLEATMSSYLIEQLAAQPNVAILPHTEVVDGGGEERLDHLVLFNRQTEERRTVPAWSLFVFIGTKPATEWLPPAVLRNDKGFVDTGRELMRRPDFSQVWRLRRDPHLLESSMPRVFAVGDVRAGGMARVASAVGEGSMAVKFVHQVLAEG